MTGAGGKRNIMPEPVCLNRSSHKSVTLTEGKISGGCWHWRTVTLQDLMQNTKVELTTADLQ